jgi:Zn-dependent protease
MQRHRTGSNGSSLVLYGPVSETPITAAAVGTGRSTIVLSRWLNGLLWIDGVINLICGVTFLIPGWQLDRDSVPEHVTHSFNKSILLHQLYPINLSHRPLLIFAFSSSR